MKSLLPLIQIALSLLLIGAILLQRSDASLGSAFGADSNITRYSRRGFEKTLFRTTIGLAILFALSGFLSLFLGR